ncbi:hypothetical protein [Arcticibacter sp.]|uniref:hypothetical protein n=1 Tax=Arcticibacter sp. TaxID=1872630 RepID=UPI00388F9424
MIKLFLLLLMLPLSVLSTDLDKVRAQFYQAVENKAVAEKFLERMKRDQGISAVHLAYYGCAQTLMGKHAWNPYQKLAHLKSGMQVLSTASKKAPDDLEIRFLRFSIEHYLPSFLGMSKHLDEDRKKIVSLVQKRQYGSLGKDVLKNMVTFVIESGRANGGELDILNQSMK